MDRRGVATRRADRSTDDRSVRDRPSVFGLIGGLLGVTSLSVPYVSATGSVAGVDVQRVEYTLFELVGESSEPELAWLVVALIVGGTALALAGAFFGATVSAVGGLCMGLGAGAIAYVVATEDPTIAFGFGTVDLATEPGLSLLAVAALVSLLAVVE